MAGLAGAPKLIDRALERKAFGRQLYMHDTIGEWIAKSRIEIDQARLLALKAVWMVDNVGAKEARKEISMIKALADHWTWGRALRYADGPDEVRLQEIARMEIRRSKESLGSALPYLTLPVRIH